MNFRTILNSLAFCLGLSTAAALSNAAWSATPAAPPQVCLNGKCVATQAGSSGFGIKVVGNTFTDLSGNVLQLQGTNISGLEISYSSGMWDGYNNTTQAQWVAIKNAWTMNVIRLPFNEWAWRTNALSAAGVAYQTIVKNTVANITAAGMYCILDLHWAAPNVYTGNLTGNNSPGYADGQQGYLNMDNSPSTWASVANAFKNNPAVLFEMFNEPIADGANTTWPSNELQILKDNSAGATFTFYDAPTGGNFQSTGKTFTPAGHQQIVNAIRGTGATNVILWSTTNWDNNMSQSLSVRPTDRLSPSQLGATIHYAGGNAGDYQNVLNAGYPILMTEFYQPNISGSSPSGYAYLQKYKIGYVMWGANNWSWNSDLSGLIKSSPWSYNGQSVAWP